MGPKRTAEEMPPSPMSFGVEEGTEVIADGPIWSCLVVPEGALVGMFGWGLSRPLVQRSVLQYWWAR